MSEAHTFKATLIFGFLILFFNTIFAQINIKEAFPNLEFAQIVDVQTANDNSNRLFVVSQRGIIYSIDNDANTTEKNVFLDISQKVIFGGEQGLLGLEFHPNFTDSGYFYLNYTASNPRRTIVSRYRVSAGNPQKADEQSEQIILSVDQPFSNHNGGQIAFGPDGYLYISFGDGGSGGDPQNNAQNRENLLGTIARIDIDKIEFGLNYSIPESNPYKNNTQGYREEIFAYGLRNVWRFSFDSTGRLWAADVGQGAWEEIHLIESGKNYGWRIIEGSHCYNPSSGCDKTGLELPLWEYAHNDQGGYSITGGHLYEGYSVEQLKGKYIYGDFVTGNIWALEKVGDQINNVILLNTTFSISTFGTDQNKELYFADYSSGIIYKFFDDLTSVETNSIVAAKYNLEQNYPNPFNPSTTIAYSVPVFNLPDRIEAAKVSLHIYDIMGRIVTTLVNETKASGKHKVSWNAADYSSGIYYYRMQADNYFETKKMLLLK